FGTQGIPHKPLITRPAQVKPAPLVHLVPHQLVRLLVAALQYLVKLQQIVSFVVIKLHIVEGIHGGVDLQPYDIAKLILGEHSLTAIARKMDHRDRSPKGRRLQRGAYIRPPPPTSSHPNEMLATKATQPWPQG